MHSVTVIMPLPLKYEFASMLIDGASSAMPVSTYLTIFTQEMYRERVCTHVVVFSSAQFGPLANA
jgi:hypothetical protein